MTENASTFPRIPLIDLIRGIALIAMAIFHFTFDLELFKLVSAGTINEYGWVMFARSIASSFLFLAGFSLCLAHKKGIKWKAMRKRLVMVGGSALVITVATYFATPDMFIFFGILHQIAVASLIGLLFLNLPWMLTLTAALFFLFVRTVLQTEAMDAPIWWWTGLSEFIPRSSDYVPMFPWFGVVLMGISFANFCIKINLLEMFSKFKLENNPARALRFLGRHSLAFYLIHQPVLIGVLSAYLWLTSGI